MTGLLIAGVDPSLTSTGLALLDTAAPADWGCKSVRTSTVKGTPNTYKRLQRIVAEVLSWTEGADLVVIEEPSLAMGTRGGHNVDRNGLYWLILDALYRRGTKVAVAKSANRCKYATGNGGAAKDAVLAAAIRRWVDAPIQNNDEGDAVVLAAMGADHLDCPPVPMPAKNREALDAVEWPL